MIIRGGTVVTARGVEQATSRSPAADHGSRSRTFRDDGEEIDASGLHVFPGGIDSHVHFNEPGRTEWETSRTGRRRWPPAATRASSTCR